jgi:hypothetical protein
MFTVPSALCGVPAVGYFIHCAAKSDEAERITRQPKKASAGQRRPSRNDPRKKIKDTMRRSIQQRQQLAGRGWDYTFDD